MKKISLILIVGVYALLTSENYKPSSTAVFHTMENSTEKNDYSIEELVGIFFKDKDISINKKSNTEFDIYDSNYYLSYINGDISYTRKGIDENNRGEFTNILFQDSLATIKKEHDTKGAYNITRVQAIEQVKQIAKNLGLSVEEPYIFLGRKSDKVSTTDKNKNLNSGIIEAFKVKNDYDQEDYADDYYYILRNDSYSTIAYKTIVDNFSKYKNFRKLDIGKRIMAVVSKDGIIQLEISKVYGAIPSIIETN